MQRATGAAKTTVWHALLVGALTLVLRSRFFDNPAIYIDEQFYLVVADRWLHQSLIPYVDVWDRKPIGIFVIYLLSFIFPNAVVGYQIIATLFVLGTCAVIYSLGKQLADARVGFAAAVLYPGTLMLMLGQGGQTPVYYNLFVAAAVWLIAKALRSARVEYGALLGAALCFGLALQVKYICVLEACALCLFALWHVARRNASGAAGLAVGMMVMGLLPTAVAGAAYAVTGHWDDFYFANFQSIFAKNIWKLSGADYAKRFLIATGLSIHVLLLSGYAVFVVLRGEVLRRPLIIAVLIWIAAAFAGGMMMGTPAEHYFLPTMAPLSLLAAMGLMHLNDRFVAHRLPGWIAPYAALMILVIIPTGASFIAAHRTERTWGKPATIYEIGDYLRTALKDGDCLYVFNRLPIFYYLSQACLPGKFIFPNHLYDASELKALPVDVPAELDRVLTSRPAMILIRKPVTAEAYPPALARLDEALAGYVLDKTFKTERQSIELYHRRD